MHCDTGIVTIVTINSSFWGVSGCTLRRTAEQNYSSGKKVKQEIESPTLPLVDTFPETYRAPCLLNPHIWNELEAKFWTYRPLGENLR